MSTRLDVAGQLDLHVAKQRDHLELLCLPGKMGRVQQQHMKTSTLEENSPVSSSYLEKLVNLSEVDPLLGVQFVDVAAVPVHKVEAEPHHLRVSEAHQHSFHLLEANRE